MDSVNLDITLQVWYISVRVHNREVIIEKRTSLLWTLDINSVIEMCSKTYCICIGQITCSFIVNNKWYIWYFCNFKWFWQQNHWQTLVWWTGQAKDWQRYFHSTLMFHSLLVRAVFYALWHRSQRLFCCTTFVVYGIAYIICLTILVTYAIPLPFATMLVCQQADTQWHG